MNAVVLEGIGQLLYRQVEPLAVPADSVRIRVAMCGICGSDVPRVFDGAVHGYPQILGHEFSGRIDEVGSQVRGLAVGQKVVAAPLIPCGKCPDCRRGDYALCGSYSFVGSRQPGAMADYVVVPAGNVLPVSESVPFEQAATVEPSTVALHALRQCGFQAGKRIAVLGCGIIGLYAIQWSRLLGASGVAAIGRGEKGLAVARKLGANVCVSTVQGGQDELEGFDYVLECSGAEQTMGLALRLAAKKGTVCYVGTPKKALTFPIELWEQINRKECWVTGSWMSYSAPFPGVEWEMTIQAMETGELRFVPELLHGIYPMKDAAKAFQEIHAGNAKGRVLLSSLPDIQGSANSER